MSFKIKSECLSCDTKFETSELLSPEWASPPCPACGSFDVRSYSPDSDVWHEEDIEVVTVEDMLDDVYQV